MNYLNGLSKVDPKHDIPLMAHALNAVADWGQHSPGEPSKKQSYLSVECLICNASQTFGKT